MKSLSVTVSQLVRRPVAEVFRAFVDPDKITQFWLQAASGPLAQDARVHWDFMVPGATERVSVTEFKPPCRIAFDWSDGINVSLDFQGQGNFATRVCVEAKGFAGTKAVEAALNATEGFSIVLCDLKTFLESGRSANLVRDKASLIKQAPAMSRE